MLPTITKYALDLGGVANKGCFARCAYQIRKRATSKGKS